MTSNKKTYNKDAHLYLSLMIDGGIYEFEPMSGSQP